MKDNGISLGSFVNRITDIIWITDPLKITPAEAKIICRILFHFSWCEMEWARIPSLYLVHGYPN